MLLPAGVSPHLAEARMRRIADGRGLLLHRDAEQDGKQAYEAMLGRPAAAAH
jgi:hypothetical protein